jgi:hypothetical protein
VLLASESAATNANGAGGYRARWRRDLCLRWRVCRGGPRHGSLFDGLAIPVAVELLPAGTSLGDAPAVRFDLRLRALKRADA